MTDDLRWCIERLLKMHYEAKVGHLGGNLSCLAGLCATIPKVKKEDRFILSKGHSAGALYVVLARAGLISEDELKTFHQDNTRLPGHPPANMFDEIPFATGSLGHGLSLAAGFAFSQKLKKNKSNTYCLTSDGEWQEGSTWEALIFICHHQLSNLTILIDHNGLQGFGSTNEVASMDPLWERTKGFDIEIIIVDGHDVKAIEKALDQPQEKPRAIFLKTSKGKWIQELEGLMKSHYLPLTQEQYQQSLTQLENLK